MQQPEADGDVVGVAAVLDRDGPVQVDEASLVAVVEHEHVELGPEAPEVPHGAQELGLDHFRLSVASRPALEKFITCLNTK